MAHTKVCKTKMTNQTRNNMRSCLATIHQSDLKPPTKIALAENAKHGHSKGKLNAYGRKTPMW